MPALELAPAVPSHLAEFQEVGFGPNQKNLHMELVREPRGHLAPRTPGGCTWRARGVPGEKSIPCVGGGAEVAQGCPGLVRHRVQIGTLQLGGRVMPALVGAGGSRVGAGRRVTGSGGDRQDRQRHLVARATSMGPGRGTRSSCLGPSGGLCPWLPSALEPRGSLPRGGVDLAGASGEGAQPPQLELGSPVPRMGCTFATAVSHVPSSARPPSSPDFIPPRLPPSSITRRCCSPFPASRILPVLRAHRAQRIGRILLLPARPALPEAGSTQHLRDPRTGDLPWGQSRCQWDAHSPI